MSPNYSSEIEILFSNVFTSVREQRGVSDVIYSENAL